MTATESAPVTVSTLSTREKRLVWGAALLFLAGIVVAIILLWPTPQPLAYPVGVPSATAPSGASVPTANQTFPGLVGYHQSYTTEFTGTSLPKGWLPFSGPIHGDGEAYYDPSHISVTNGVLILRTAKDRLNHGHWATGGMCQCGITHASGAYFVRSRAVGVGPENVAMLWPKSDKWPPSIEFLESATARGTDATLHWSKKNHVVMLALQHTPMGQWNTWGVVWTSKHIIFVVNGRAWAEISNAHAIPHIKMRLDLEQQSYCSLHFACPTKPTTMQVDWVAEYQKN